MRPSCSLTYSPEEQAGAGSVITGWDKGCLGMAMGEIRRIDIPAEEGYGARGFPAWGIPDNAGLIFEIEVLPPLALFESARHVKSACQRGAQLA